MTPATWKNIRAAAKAAGIDVDRWEADAHDRILSSILVRTDKSMQYLNDPEFHDRIEMLMRFILGAFFEHSPLSEDMRGRAEDLDTVFQNEIREAGERGRGSS